MIDGWWRWADTFAAYHDALQGRGHSARSADTFGTLLACADLALYDHLPDQELLDDWARMCAPDGLAEIADTAEDHEACLTHLTTSTVQARGGDLRETLGTWIARGVRDDALDAERAQASRERLAELGLRLVNRRTLPEPGPDGRPRYGAVDAMRGMPIYLAIAGSHRSLAEIFAGTKWALGGWTQTLGRAPHATRGVKVKFGRASLTATLVPIELVMDADEVTGFVAASTEAAA